MGRLEEAQEIQKKDPAKAEVIYKEMISKPPGMNDAELRDYELALVALGGIYRDSSRTGELAELITASRSIMSSFAKAKTAKIVRQLIDLFTTIPDTLDIQISVTKSCIEWAIQERRSFLRQNLETRLVGLYLQKHSYTEALSLINSLLKELKRLDDKMVLVEVQLLESRAYHALRNIPKSRASLTSARTSANAVYCPPLMQAGLDMQSGILHAEDKDYNTAFSYFIEALDGYSTQDETKKAIAALKYMLLSKIMLNLTDDVHQIMTGKLAIKYAGRDIEAMKAVARAHSNRSLAEFEKALEAFKEVLGSDPFIRSHFTALYDTLLEQNLVRVIEPFSRVEIEHVAKLVGLGTPHVEAKLSQMILDKVFSGVLDQGSGCLIVFDEVGRDKSYDAALETIKKLSDVVEVLYTNQASMLD
ncbi:PCI-domain-containing protein [Choiromyces venosus 120613-1]|uniref:PCI-domain-containing protein n=1 Tax=Choiromyces venosus 120613-1 TaxID=1336337 RepID=A0A3N4JMD9_9PEZI|nr:PCI-domain-containing protein [Choiromyces venosus 120613-1]